MIDLNESDRHKLLAKFSSLAYTGDFRSLNIDPSKITSYLGDALNIYIIEMSDCYIVSVRGSSKGYDWRNNFTNLGWSVDYGHTNVEPGFLEELNAWINMKDSYDKPVYLTGHSMGGAVALLYGFKLLELDQNLLEIITFGSPMPGALSFKEQLEKKLPNKIFRYRNGDDITPSVPPFKYYSVGKDIQIGVKHSWWNPIKYMHLLSDHRMSEYLKSIESYYK